MKYISYLACLTILLSCSENKKVTPKSVLVHGRGGDSVGLDPGHETDGESFKVCDNIFSTLVRYKNGSTEIIPDLAERWEISTDGLQYDFYLRKNVIFHDDTPFNADAVLFSFNRQRLKEHPFYNVGGAWQYWEAMAMNSIVRNIEKVNDHQVRFNLHKAEAPFLSNLGMNFASIVSPTAVGKYKENFSRNPVGTGPYKFTKWVKNQLVELQAFEKYFGEIPTIKRIIFKAIPDNSARFLELMAGKIDVMDYPNPSDVKEISTNQKLKMKRQSGMNVGYLAMNMDKKPFDNVLVRQAINHAINKQAIVDAVYEGLGQVAKNPIPPSMWGYNENIPGYDYDIDKAKGLLAKAGLPKGFKTSLYALPVARPYMPNGRKVAEAIQADLKKVGIEVKILSFEWGTYLDKMGKGEHEMGLLGWTGDNGDPDNFLYLLLDKNSTKIPAQNIAFYRSEELHKVLIDAKKALSLESRVKLYEKAQEIIFKDAPWVPIAHSVEVLPMSKEILGLEIDPTGKRRFAEVSFAK